ncbi:CoA ester lyase [Amycolatopsis ultiminotia]|uniref:CoA ester lyase n=1 Tax=Amycolatopsis ultiminotia TaxID=543629 RepID=A0ABP6UZU8_9PSEU
MDLGRTVLFCPGDHPRRVERALAAPAATVVLDLEDGVAPEARVQARATVVRALAAAHRPRLFVRVNASGTAEQSADFAALAPVLGHGAGVVLPKAGSGAEITAVAERLAGIEHTAGALRIVPVVETCAGLLAAAEIAAADRVAALILGVLDLAAELRVSPAAGLDHARAHLAIAARAAGLPGPIDGPHPALDDDEGLTRTSLASRALGFRGRVVLHPRQLDPVDRAYAPAPEEIRHARKVVEATGAGSLRLPDGTFVDRPVVARAHAVLAEAGEVAADGHASA